MAMKLLAAAGWDGREVSDQLEALRPALPGEPDWTAELRESTRHIAGRMQGPPLPPETPAEAGGPAQAAPKPLAPDLPPSKISAPF